jgi:hypothetical protein
MPLRMLARSPPRPRMRHKPREVIRGHRGHHGRVKRTRQRGMRVQRVPLASISRKSQPTPISKRALKPAVVVSLWRAECAASRVGVYEDLGFSGSVTPYRSRSAFASSVRPPDHPSPASAPCWEYRCCERANRSASSCWRGARCGRSPTSRSNWSNGELVGGAQKSLMIINMIR